jgi:hypothetical protein
VLTVHPRESKKSSETPVGENDWKRLQAGEVGKRVQTYHVKPRRQSVGRSRAINLLGISNSRNRTPHRDRCATAFGVKKESHPQGHILKSQVTVRCLQGLAPACRERGAPRLRRPPLLRLWPLCRTISARVEVLDTHRNGEYIESKRKESSIPTTRTTSPNMCHESMKKRKS